MVRCCKYFTCYLLKMIKNPLWCRPTLFDVSTWSHDGVTALQIRRQRNLQTISVSNISEAATCCTIIMNGEETDWFDQHRHGTMLRLVSDSKTNPAIVVFRYVLFVVEIICYINWSIKKFLFNFVWSDHSMVIHWKKIAAILQTRFNSFSLFLEYNVCICSNFTFFLW